MKFKGVVKELNINGEVEIDFIDKIEDDCYRLNKDFINNENCYCFKNRFIYLFDGQYSIEGVNLKINNVIYKNTNTDINITNRTRIDFENIMIKKASQDLFLIKGTTIQLLIEDDTNDFTFTPKLDFEEFYYIIDIVLP